MCKWTEEEVDLRSGSQRHRHFVGFFNVSVQVPRRGYPFYGYSEKLPDFSRLLRRARGYGGPILVLNLPGPHGGGAPTKLNDDMVNDDEDLLVPLD